MDNREIHTCVFCGITFSRTNALNGHMRVHKEEKNKVMKEWIINLNKREENQQEITNSSQKREELDLELRLGPSKAKKLDLSLRL
ncbi:unnamed protein product [Lathyrus oleraceus]